MAMEPNPKSFPILSFVMSRLQPKPAETLEPDIEQPEPRSDEVELVSRMPHLAHPGLIASMGDAVAEVARSRSVLDTLGDRPDHELVDAARARLADLDAALSRDLEDIVRDPRPEAADRLAWRAEQADRERARRAEADREKGPWKAVVQLDAMHEAHQALLRAAEEKLEKMYDRATANDEGGDPATQGEQVNEDVIGILQEASGRCVERVELSDRQLRFLPEAFGRMQGLISLDISNNLLQTIPDSIAGLEHLEELRVSSNSLVSLPDSIGLLLSLKILDVSGNKLKALPDSISSCRSLVELNASYNDLTYLPTNIGYELANLQKLSVHLNKLRSLPTSVCEMRSLRFLDAHFNELRGLPYAIGNLANLETLNLSSNFSDMRALPDSIGDLTNLAGLDLSNNQIHALPDTFARLGNLVRLNLDGNPMLVPPPEVVSQGIGAIMEHMANRLQASVLEEQTTTDRIVEEEDPESRVAGWLTRSTSWLSDFVSGVSGSVSGYLGDKSPRDPYLDQLR